MSFDQLRFQALGECSLGGSSIDDNVWLVRERSFWDEVILQQERLEHFEFLISLHPFCFSILSSIVQMKCLSSYYT